MYRSLEVTAAPGEYRVEHAGKIYSAHLSKTGSFSLVYRSERLTEDSLTGLRERMEGLDLLAAERRDRAKALKEAAAAPVPALYGADLEPVGVRGIDQRSGNLLLTHADGSTGKARHYILLRPLSPEERSGYDALRQEEVAAKQAIDALAQPVSLYEVSKVDLALTAEYVPAADAFFLTYEGKTFGPGTPRELRQQVTCHLARQQYGAAVDREGEIVATATASDEDLSRTELFPDRAAAQAYLSAKERYLQAAEARKVLVEKYAFDTSLLGG